MLQSGKQEATWFDVFYGSVFSGNNHGTLENHNESSCWKQVGLTICHGCVLIEATALLVPKPEVTEDISNAATIPAELCKH